MTISLNSFIKSGYEVGSKCASPDNNYWGLAVKTLNNSTYGYPFYDYNQQKYIQKRYRNELHRASPEDKKNYSMFFIIVGVIAFLIICVIYFKSKYAVE